MSEVTKIKQRIQELENHLKALVGVWELGMCGCEVDYEINLAEKTITELNQKLQEYEQETRS